jgi:hypothetical protein
MERVADALRREGYVGPTCVDAMILRGGALVPLLEINARKSFGLLHCSLRRTLELSGDSEVCAWPLVLTRRCDLGDLLAALGTARFDGRRGLLPLAGRTISVNEDELPSRGSARGRLYALLAWDEVLPRERLVQQAEAALAGLGAHLRGGPR